MYYIHINKYLRLTDIKNSLPNSSTKKKHMQTRLVITYYVSIERTLWSENFKF